MCILIQIRRKKSEFVEETEETKEISRDYYKNLVYHMV